MSSTAFKNTAPRHLSTSDAIFQTNDRLVGKMPNDAFVTMFYLIYDSNSNTLRYTQAGHPDGFVLRPQTGEVLRLSTAGSLVGVFSGSGVEFPEKQIHLKKGDKVVLYTDAIYETLMSADPQAAFDPLEKYLRSNIHHPLGQLFEGLYRHGLQAVQLDQYDDDFTLVGFEVTAE
jgi:serine phosphatase RsbU (regulator of sigma subunit)